MDTKSSMSITKVDNMAKPYTKREWYIPDIIIHKIITTSTNSNITRFSIKLLLLFFPTFMVASSAFIK